MKPYRQEFSKVNELQEATDAKTQKFYVGKAQRKHSWAHAQTKTLLAPYTKINFKLIIVLNINTQTTKLLEENGGKTFITYY